VGGTVLLLPRGAGGRRPDLVLVVWDTCRADRLSLHGYRRPTTPLLAAWSAGGTVFRSCYTPSPWTPPAHASLFTGLLPRNHGLRERKTDRIRAGLPILPRTLAAAGYETVAIVANPFLSPVTGLVDGFGTVIPCYAEGSGKGTAPDVLARFGEWLVARRNREERRDRPLFLFVNLMDSHLPYSPARADAEEVLGEGNSGPALAIASGTFQQHVLSQNFGISRLDAAAGRALGDAYDASVRTLDRATGEILARLEAEGLLEGALAAVAGDHGENLGEHGDYDHILSCRDTVLHVPLVVRWPGRIPAGRFEDAQVRLQDLYPTFLEAARVPVPPGCGLDAVSLLEAPVRPRVAVSEFGPADDFLYSAGKFFPELPPQAVRRIRTALLSVREPPGPGARKYLSWTYHGEGGPGAPEREELLDAVLDPGELVNLLEGGGEGPERERARRLAALGAARHPPAFGDVPK
jgi:arylsulfatase A-like enzyme